MTKLNEPLLPDVGVLALVADTWSMYWQSRHHVLSRLASFFPVVWLGPAHEWQDALTNPRVPSLWDAALGPGFTVHRSERWLPRLYRPQWLAKLSFQERLKRAHSLLTARGCEKIILYIWRPEFEPALRAVPFDLSCYHIDDEYTFSPVDLPIPDTEARLIRCVDQVFVSSRALFEKKGRSNPHTTFVPNGVDYQAYTKWVHEPPDLVPIPHPRIGYSGFLKKQLDWPLLSHLTARHPDWSFVFVGPQNNQAEIEPFIQELLRLANVHFLGAKLTPELAGYPQHFDVCIMPYRLDDYTKYIYPLKLHEYLASGRPTAGTRIHSLVEFTEVVALPNTWDEWSAAISTSLSPAANEEARRAERQSVARRHDWRILVSQIAKTMARGLGADYAERFDKSLKISGIPLC